MPIDMNDWVNRHVRPLFPNGEVRGDAVGRIEVVFPAPANERPNRNLVARFSIDRDVYEYLGAANEDERNLRGEHARRVIFQTASTWVADGDAPLEYVIGMDTLGL